MRPRELRSEYYQDRWSEYDLCNDFPGDEVLIDGLHALQTHFIRRGINIDIPVVRIMNTAHFLACYMFATTCSGDQREYDALTYGSVGQDKQLTVISLIVLAAMLKRTDGMRARNCRSVLLEDRSEDFYEGVSLYEQFLQSGEAHFAQEDFESDVMNEVVTLREQNAQLVQQVMTMQKTIKEMNQQNNQFNIGTQNNYNGCTFNKYYIQPNTAQPEAEQTQEAEPASDYFRFITKAAYNKGIAEQIEEELRSACVSAPKLIKVIRTNEALGYLDTKNLSSAELYKLLNEHYHLPFGEDNFRKYRAK